MANIESTERENGSLVDLFRKDFPTYLNYLFFNQGLQRGYVLDSINESIGIFPVTKSQKALYAPYINSMGIFRRRIMDERNIDVSEADLDKLCAIYFEMINGTTRDEAQTASRLLPQLEKELFRES